MSFARRRLGAESVNVAKSAFKDKRRRRTENHAWERPLIRIARALTAILNNPTPMGLHPNPEGFFPVQDLLKLPSLQGLDFFSIERAVRMYRPHHITLAYSPQINSSSDQSLTSWWIALHPSRFTLPPRRLIQPDTVPDMIYKVPSVHWETIRERGISRWLNHRLVFNTKHIVPPKHAGDYTFIRLDPQKLLNSSQYPIYSTFRHSTRPRFHDFSETFTTSAPNIPPSTFKSATRIAVERFPLMLPASTIFNDTSYNNKKRIWSKKRKKDDEMVVMQSGIEALHKFGYGGMLRGTELQKLWKEQEEANASQKQNSSPEVIPTNRVVSTTPDSKNRRLGRHISTKDRPHRTRRL